jgi:hypothetical protein
MPLSMKSFVWQLVYASKSTFFLIQIAVQSKLGIKISDQIKIIVTRGGGGGSEKANKCHVLFEWPLTLYARVLKPDLCGLFWRVVQVLSLFFCLFLLSEILPSFVHPCSGLQTKKSIKNMMKKKILIDSVTTGFLNVGSSEGCQLATVTL